MRVTVNGRQTDLPEGATVGLLVAQQGAPDERRGVAVAVDAEVVPRSAWEGTVLREGQQVELVRAIQGG